MAGRICLSDSRWIHDRATRPMSGADFDQRRELDRASGNPVRATRLKAASSRDLSDGRNGAFDGRERTGAVGRKSRNGAEQALRIGMSGRVKDIGLRAQLD